MYVRMYEYAYVPGLARAHNSIQMEPGTTTNMARIITTNMARIITTNMARIITTNMARTAEVQRLHCTWTHASRTRGSDR